MTPFLLAQPRGPRRAAAHVATRAFGPPAVRLLTLRLLTVLARCTCEIKIKTRCAWQVCKVRFLTKVSV